VTSIDLDKALHQFCTEINGGNPITVVSRPEAWAMPDYCFANVDRKVKECGGTVRFGWHFLQVPVGAAPGILTAVHHAVWESPEKELIDITPFVAKGLVCRASDGVFFLADDKATVLKPVGYEIGVSRPSKFFALGRTAKVRKMVEAARLCERQYWDEITKMMLA
jgi:hypothetical protein